MISLDFRLRNEGAKSKPPFVFIHGAMGSKLTWLPLSRHLAGLCPEREGYLLDLPGHGDSPGKSADCVCDYAQVVLEFLDEHSIEKAVLVGHSMGGAIAQQLALDVPERVASLVLVCTGAKIKVADAIFMGLQGAYDQTIEAIRFIGFHESAPEKMRALTIEQMRPVGPQVGTDDFTACAGFDVREQLPNLRIPALVCVGEADQMISVSTNRKLAELLDTDLKIINKAGHMLPVERPEELAAEIHKFIEAGL